MNKAKFLLMFIYGILMMVLYFVAGVLQLTASLIVFLINALDRHLEFDRRDIEYSYLAEGWSILHEIIGYEKN